MAAPDARSKVLLAYVDESGDEQSLRTPDDPPVLVIAGVVVDHERAKSLVWKYLQLKKRFNDSLRKKDVRLSDLILFEVKGSELRKDIRSATRRNRRRAFGFLDSVLKLLAEEHATVIGQVYIKGEKSLSKWIYADAVAAIAEQFEAQLRAAETQGCMVLDARTKWKNTPNVHRVTTARFKSGGDPFFHLIDSPMFGHSDAHVALQIADIVASAVLFPMACAGYCGCLIHNIHLNDEFAAVRRRYATRLRLLEHRYDDNTGKRLGGIRVTDYLNHQPTLQLYQDVPLDLSSYGL